MLVFIAILIDLCVSAILASVLSSVMARPSDRDFIWNADYYVLFSDTLLIEKLVSPPYFKERTIRELL